MQEPVFFFLLLLFFVFCMQVTDLKNVLRASTTQLNRWWQPFMEPFSNLLPCTCNPFCMSFSKASLESVLCQKYCFPNASLNTNNYTTLIDPVVNNVDYYRLVKTQKKLKQELKAHKRQAVNKCNQVASISFELLCVGYLLLIHIIYSS